MGVLLSSARQFAMLLLKTIVVFFKQLKPEEVQKSENVQKPKKPKAGRQISRNQTNLKEILEKL